MPEQRIASLLASATEILYGLGVGDQVVAVSHECDFPEDATGKPRVTFTRIDADRSSLEIDEQVKEMVRDHRPLYEIDRAALASLRPDFIVTQSHCDVCAVKYDDVVRTVREDEALTSTTIVDLNPDTLEGVFRDVMRVGEAIGCPDAAHAYVRSLRDRVASVRSVSASLTAAERPRVACVEWIEPLMLGANWMPDLVEIAGGQSETVKPGRPSEYVNWSNVVTFDPEVVVVMPCGFDLTRTLAEARVMTTWPGWGDLAAVRAGRVWAVDGNAFFNRSGPRIVDSLEILAWLLHPNRFAPPRTTPDPAWASLA